jgi:hypothetical protein
VLCNIWRNHLFTHRDHYWWKAGRHAAIHYISYRCTSLTAIKWFCFTQESLRCKKNGLYVNSLHSIIFSSHISC